MVEAAVGSSAGSSGGWEASLEGWEGAAEGEGEGAAEEGEGVEEEEVSPEEVEEALAAAVAELAEEDADDLAALQPRVEEAIETLSFTALLLGDWDDLPHDHAVYGITPCLAPDMPIPHRHLPVLPESSDALDVDMDALLAQRYAKGVHVGV